MGGFLSNIVNPIHAEIQAAHAKLSPPAQEAIARAAQPAPLQPEASPVSAVSTQRSLTANPDTPPPPQMGMPSPQGMAPMMGMPSPTMAPVTAPRGTVEGDQTKLAQMTASGPGVSQIYHNITNSRFGQAHPLAGKVVGGGLQGLATAAEAAGSMFGPTRNAEAVIPGTTAHHALLEHELERNIAGEEKARTEEAQQQEIRARSGLIGAQTEAIPSEEHLREAKAFEALHPNATNELEMLRQEHPDWTAEQIQQQMETTKANAQVHPLSKEEADSLNAVWDPIAGRSHLPTGQFREGMPRADATTLAGAMNNAISRGQGAQRITIEEGRQGQTGNARVDRSYQYNQSELDKIGKPISDLTFRMGRFMDTLAQNTPQADALVAPELLTVMAGGMGSGLRMNEAEISRIVGGRSNWETLKAAVNKWSLDPASARSITPEQQREIRALAQTVQAKLQQKQTILDQASNSLAGSEDVNQHRQIVSKARQAITAIDEGREGGAAQFKVPEGAPAAPKEDNKYLYDENYKAIAKSQGGQWVAP